MEVMLGTYKSLQTLEQFSPTLLKIQPKSKEEVALQRTQQLH